MIVIANLFSLHQYLSWGVLLYILYILLQADTPPINASRGTALTTSSNFCPPFEVYAVFFTIWCYQQNDAPVFWRAASCPFRSAWKKASFPGKGPAAKTCVHKLPRSTYPRRTCAYFIIPQEMRLLCCQLIDLIRPGTDNTFGEHIPHINSYVCM